MIPKVEDWRMLGCFPRERSLESWCDWTEFKSFLRSNDEELYHAYMNWKASEKLFTKLVQERVNKAEDENEDD